ncbi:hypothetical protein [Alicyclobacillus sp. ALC3]|uniref:hypothetical protein n=1 Tax=Alicyclobacillus sp. ALC3 TaxID=2796143 RepID=UPI002379078C|nr:hypothetical protein [Alicyclobacillus sp. ALC3]WDL95899.1 hypothetical protein JC200_16280 [Alicyclobacillus sp. ALC3]
MGVNDEDWEKRLLQPPVSRHLSDEMRRNIHKRIVAVEKKSTNGRFNRAMAGLASIAAVCVAVASVYFITGHSFTHLVGTASQPSASNGWSTADVEQFIIRNEKGHSVTNIKVIYASSSDGFKLAFASFDLDGQLKYGSIFDSSIQSLGVFTVSLDKGNPLQFTESVEQNGFNLVTGVVVGDPRISNVVLTFKNGTIKTVPVVGGKFWYAGKIGATDTVSFTQHVLGVTDTGQIIENSTHSK